MKEIVVYDFDKTIYNGETSTDFMIFFLTKNPKYLFRIYYLFISLFYYFIDLKKSKEYFFKIIENIEIKKLNDNIELFWKYKKKKIFKYFYNEIVENKKNAKELILISATPSIFLEKLSKELGFDKLIATDFINQKDYFISEIVGKNCKGKEKVIRLNEYINEYRILAFYSDSMSDKPLFDISENKYYIKKGEKIKI